MSLFHKDRRVMAAAIETTAGTAMTLSGSNTIFCFDPVIQGDIPMSDRFAQGTMSRLASIPGAQKGTLSVTVELAGSGSATDPLWASTFLPACGMVGTAGVYAFSSDPANHKTLTIGVMDNTFVRTLVGAKGTFVIDAKAGEFATIKFTFTGRWVSPSDGSMLALPSYTQKPPRFAGATITVGGSGIAPISTFSLDIGNSVDMTQDATNTTGYNIGWIASRNPKGKIDPEQVSIATNDVYGSWKSGTEAALSVAIGSASHNTITIAGPHCQYTNVQSADRNNLLVTELDYQLNGSSAGDDEMTITLS